MRTVCQCMEHRLQHLEHGPGPAGHAALLLFVEGDTQGHRDATGPSEHRPRSQGPFSGGSRGFRSCFQQLRVEISIFCFYSPQKTAGAGK